MKTIEFSREETRVMTTHLQAWFRDELDQDSGALQAEALIAFFGEQAGGYFYNRGLYDAQAIVAARVEEMADAIYGLEKKTDFLR